MAQLWLRRPPSYNDPLNQEDQRALAVLDSVPAEIRSCVWAVGFRHTWAIDEAKSRIDACQRIRNDYLLKQTIGDWLPVTAVIVFLALVIRFRRMIGAVLYDMFVYVLTFGIRLKKVLNQALKEVADRTR
ncbi:MAG: hypothetical protein WA183_02025 [Chthoniobacterales bacterium]